MTPCLQEAKVDQMARPSMGLQLGDQSPLSPGCWPLRLPCTSPHPGARTLGRKPPLDPEHCPEWHWGWVGCRPLPRSRTLRPGLTLRVQNLLGPQCPGWTLSPKSLLGSLLRKAGPNRAGSWPSGSWA